MTQQRRIVLNVVATYGRSLISLCIGLFTSRWILESLGAVNYGLYAMVGSLIGFMVMINGIIAGAVSRFYAYSVGKAKVAESHSEGLDECRRWFSIALMLHLAIAAALMIVGYPLGRWAIQNYLNIPADRVSACLFVWLFSCVACFVGMVSVPFSAMYQAKQEIAELTIYSIAQSIATFFFVLYMVQHPGDWLAKYSAWACVLSTLPQAFIVIRAMVVYPECKFRIALCRERKYWMELGRYVQWQVYFTFTAILRGQGLSVVLNKFFGPVVNAAQGIGTTVNMHASALSTALTGAFSPAIINECGAGEMERMKEMAYRATKFSLFLSLIFMLPLMLELKEILVLWLHSPPRYAYGFCLFSIIGNLIDKAMCGQWIAINATGNIAQYQKVMCTISLVNLPLAIVVAYLTKSPYAVAIAIAAMVVVNTAGTILFARRIAKMSVRYWLTDTILPLCVACIISIMVGLSVKALMHPSFLRICVTSMASFVGFVCVSMKIVLNPGEREYLLKRIMDRVKFRRSRLKT